MQASCVRTGIDFLRRGAEGAELLRVSLNLEIWNLEKMRSTEYAEYTELKNPAFANDENESLRAVLSRKQTAASQRFFATTDF